MDQKQKNTILLGALIAGILAFFLPWLTVILDRTEVGGLAMLAVMMSGGEATLTAVNGSSSFLGVNAPIWFVLSLALIANVLPLLNYTRHFSVPRGIEGVLAFVAFAWVASMVVLSYLHDSKGMRIEIGWVLAMVCATGPVYCFLRPVRSEKPTL